MDRSPGLAAVGLPTCPDLLDVCAVV